LSEILHESAGLMLIVLTSDLSRLEAADAVAVVLGLQAEGHVDAESERPLLVDRQHEVEIGHHREIAGVTAVAPSG
jgi:hypothetical protein